MAVGSSAFLELCLYLSTIFESNQDIVLTEDRHVICEAVSKRGLKISYTLQGLLDELDLVECFEAPGHGKMLGEMTKKQADLYQKLGIDPPSLEIPGI